MSNGQENNLTSHEDSDIILSMDERRIVRNLREHAAFVKYGEFTVTFKVHDNAIKFGNLHFADTTQRV